MENMEIDYKKIVLDYLDTSITHDMNDWDSVDVKAYTESTADGYELFIVTMDDQHPSINEDVHYYDSDVAVAVMENLEQGYSVYMDSYLYDDLDMDGQFEEFFGSNVENIIMDNPDLFNKEQLEYVSEEYGIEIEE